MSKRGWMPEDGKIFAAAPHVAARLAEFAPEPDRIYVIPGCPPGEVYVFDLNAIRAEDASGE